MTMGDPDIGQIDEFTKVREALSKLPNVKVCGGSWLTPRSDDEVLAGEAFVDANHLQIGDRGRCRGDPAGAEPRRPV